MVSIKRLSELLEKYFKIRDADEYLLDYISDLIKNHDLSEVSLEDIDYFLKETFEECALLSEKERLSSLQKLLFEVKFVNKLSSDLKHLSASSSSDERLDESLSIPIVDKKDYTSVKRNPATYQRDALIDSNVQQLLELCHAKVCSGYLKHVLLNDFDGDMERAADWLLEANNLVQLEQRWRREELRRHEEEEAEEAALQKAKKEIINKFDLEKVPETMSLRKPGDKKKSSLVAWNTTEETDRKVRYRDGEAVAFKGEKFIVKADRPDWDGGSRGKVYTKGKRGKGFV